MGFKWTGGANREGKSGYYIWFDFDADKVKQLKERVNWQWREWYPEEKKWWVSEYCEKDLDDLFPGFLEAVAASRPLPGFEPGLEELWG